VRQVQHSIVLHLSLSAATAADPAKHAAAAAAGDVVDSSRGEWIGS